MNPTQNIKNFLNSKNVSMLWEVLLDELNINPNSSAILQNIKTVFDGNISLFTTKANPNMGLMNLNKLFLNQVLIAVNQLFPNLKQEQQQMKLINISDEVIGEPYKVEDIHNARQTDFDKQVTDKRAEFENSINMKKPQPVDFSDKVEPEMKIMEMEALIAETMAKRKFDIEQIQGLNANVNANVNNTSINVKKTPSVQAKAEKTVSFSDNVTLHIDDYENENVNENVNENNNKNNKEPDVQNSIFNKLKKTTPDTNLSEMNLKIDTLVTMMSKIVLLLENRK